MRIHFINLLGELNTILRITLSLNINVGRDVPTLRVTFSGYFSGTDAYFCGFLLGPVHMFASFSGADAPDILHSTCEQLALLISLYG